MRRQIHPNGANLARTFTPSRPMGIDGMKPEQMWVLQDIPPALKKNLKDGMKQIGPTCLKQNAEIFLRIYEDICIEHVLSKIPRTKTFEKLIQSNPDNLDGGSIHAPNCVLVRSSMLGQDPWGDKPLPIAPRRNRSQSGDTFTTIQSLLVDMQTKIYAYLTMHVNKVVEMSIWVRIKEEERKYKKDAFGCRSNSARGRMPWSRYKSLINGITSYQQWAMS